MADHVNAANAIYENTDFDGDGQFEGRLGILLTRETKISYLQGSI